MFETVLLKLFVWYYRV